jgi:hypothetical protein
MTLLAIAGIGCGGNNVAIGPNGTAAKENPSFSQDIQKIFNNRGCTTAGCHDIGGQQLGLILNPDSSYLKLVNVASSENAAKKLVMPNDTAQSYLVDKVSGTQSVGDRMPLGLSPLTAIEIQNIKNWIMKGALNN